MMQRAGAPGEWVSSAFAGVRDAGMGNASVGLGGAASVFSNPAGLGSGQLGEMNINFAPLLEGGDYQSVSLSHPLSPRHYLGFGMAAYSSGEAEMTDEIGQSRGSFSEQDMLGVVGYGYRGPDAFDVGVNAKFLRQSLAQYSGAAYGLDLGIRLRTVSGALTWAALCQNLLQPNLTLDRDSETYPRLLRFGPTWELKSQGRHFIAALEATWDPADSGGLWRRGLGVEVKPFSSRPTLMLRAGADQKQMSVGFGINNGIFTFDYAAALHELGVLHRFGITLSYGYIAPLAQRKLEAAWRRLQEQKTTAQDLAASRGARKDEPPV
ncbi:MAG: hypothetical protein AABZ44_04525, partial [Elusimicrobiota bacterium]